MSLKRSIWYTVVRHQPRDDIQVIAFTMVVLGIIGVFSDNSPLTFFFLMLLAVGIMGFLGIYFGPYLQILSEAALKDISEAPWCNKARNMLAKKLSWGFLKLKDLNDAINIQGAYEGRYLNSDGKEITSQCGESHQEKIEEYKGYNLPENIEKYIKSLLNSHVQETLEKFRNLK